MGSVAENMAGDLDAARRLVDEAAAVLTGLDYLSGRLAVLQARALLGFADGDLAAVRAAAVEAEGLARDSGDLYVLGVMQLNRGAAALLGGALDEAGPLLDGALRIACQLDDRVAQACLLDAFGCQAALAGRPGRAVRLLGAAAALGPARFAAEYEAGRQLSRDAAADLA